ncbi:hypothetical protein BC828DRAFT_384945 [Blastocladiella britannica]|nr:hypothetical protein BC828DRAFT_384945 [Blastocladiella britannica]
MPLLLLLPLRRVVPNRRRRLPRLRSSSNSSRHNSNNNSRKYTRRVPQPRPLPPRPRSRGTVLRRTLRARGPSGLQPPHRPPRRPRAPEFRPPPPWRPHVHPAIRVTSGPAGTCTPCSWSRKLPPRCHWRLLLLAPRCRPIRRRPPRDARTP